MGTKNKETHFKGIMLPRNSQKLEIYLRLLKACRPLLIHLVPRLEGVARQLVLLDVVLEAHLPVQLGGRSQDLEDIGRTSITSGPGSAVVDVCRSSHVRNGPDGVGPRGRESTDQQSAERAAL